MAVAVKGDDFALGVGPHPGEKNTLIVLQAANPRLLLDLPGELNLHSRQRKPRGEANKSGVRVGEKHRLAEKQRNRLEWTEGDHTWSGKRACRRALS